MATVVGSQSAVAKGVIKTTWTITGTDDGRPETAPQFPLKTAIFTGTFGGGTVVMEESADGITYVGCVNPQGTAVTFSGNGSMVILSNQPYIRPRASVGVTSVVITLTSASQQ